MRKSALNKTGLPGRRSLKLNYGGRCKIISASSIIDYELVEFKRLYPKIEIDDGRVISVEILTP